VKLRCEKLAELAIEVIADERIERNLEEQVNWMAATYSHSSKRIPALRGLIWLRERDLNPRPPDPQSEPEVLQELRFDCKC
jgi:hypothetical protein